MNEYERKYQELQEQARVRAGEWVKVEGCDLPRGMIFVWPFDQAPPVLRELSQHGGDEDWLALIPPTFSKHYISWCDPAGNSAFGVSEISEHILPNGWFVRIGAHA